MAEGKMEEKFGALLRLITLVNVCGRGGVHAAEEGHGPEDINFVVEEGESVRHRSLGFPNREMLFDDIALRGGIPIISC